MRVGHGLPRHETSRGVLKERRCEPSGMNVHAVSPEPHLARCSFDVAERSSHGSRVRFLDNSPVLIARLTEEDAHRFRSVEREVEGCAAGLASCVPNKLRSVRAESAEETCEALALHRSGEPKVLGARSEPLSFGLTALGVTALRRRRR